MSLGGASEYFNITPDLICFGKIIGGGFPVGAFGGRADVMKELAPLGGVYQAGTLSGNPIAMSAGLATLKELEKPDFYNHLNQFASSCLTSLESKLKYANKEVHINKIASMFSVFFQAPDELINIDSVHKCNHKQFTRFYKKALNEGIYLSPSGYETNFISTAHKDRDFARLEEAFVRFA